MTSGNTRDESTRGRRAVGNDMFNEEQLADAKVRADAAVFRESLTPDLGFDFVAYAREVLADKDHKDRDDLSCLAMEIMGALVSSIDRLQGRLDSLHRSKVEYGVSERLKLIAAVKANAAEADRLRLALAEATRERENWIETARTYAKGEDYYRGLIDAALKDDPAAYVADDGSISEDVLRAKLPEMYALAVTERKRAEAEFDRFRQDRYDALNAQTTEGWSAAEWQLRTGKAERERDAAVALVREVADSGVEFEDERISYVAVQIDRETFAAVRALAQKGAPE